MITEKALVRCPFCDKNGVVAFYKPPHREPSSSRIAGKSVTKQIMKDESYYIQSDCPHCGAKKRDIQDYYDGKYKKKISHEERLKAWRQRGLPMILGSE